ncbi:MAG: RsmB/NOP family class I SAM-dependent RNA methyltransferase, partial [Rubrimonas sp.]
DLSARLQRAGARAETAHAGSLKALKGRCDLVLVDAPCSGSGSWRRDPLGKWRLTPRRLDEIGQAQHLALAAAAAYVRPGGRLVYATCSLLVSENEERFAAWLGGDAAGDVLRLTPDMGGDGFFAAAARRAEGDVFVVA